LGVHAEDNINIWYCNRLSCCTGQNGCEQHQYTCILSLLIITKYWIYWTFTNVT